MLRWFMPNDRADIDGSYWQDSSVPYDFPPDTKFAAIHLSRCSCSGLPNVLPLNNDLSAHTLPIMALTELDKSRIGADYAEAFTKSNLVLVASMLSRTAGVLDGESQELERRAYMLFYAVLMQGVPNFWPGVLTLGSRPGTPTRGRTVSRLLTTSTATAMRFRSASPWTACGKLTLSSPASWRCSEPTRNSSGCAGASMA